MAKKIDNAILDELLKGYDQPRDLMADGDLMKDLRKALMQRMLGAECVFRRSRPRIPIGSRPPIPVSFRPGFRFEAGHFFGLSLGRF